MTLAPELRNHIYRELLLFHDSYSCQPQILATCKMIHSEASDILYRDNLIEVKLRRERHGFYEDSSVQAHGKYCGFMEKFGAVNGDLTDLRWPDFLKRAQWIRFSVQFESLLGNPTVAIPQPEVARANEHNINYALYSLCSFLQGKHSLVAIEVDAGMKLADILVKPARGTCEVTALYVLDPLQLLGPLPLFKIINYDGSVAQLTQSSFPVQERLDGGVIVPLQHLSNTSCRSSRCVRGCGPSTRRTSYPTHGWSHQSYESLKAS